MSNWYGNCNQCGHPFTADEVSQTGCYVCPICGKLYQAGLPQAQQEEQKADDIVTNTEG